MRGRGTSPEGKAVPHQAADEGLVGGEELRCVKEGLCTMEDAQLTTGFGGQLVNVVCPRKTITDSEAQTFE